MADTKISELTELAAAELAGADSLPLVDASAAATKRVTVTSLDSRYLMESDVAAKGDLLVATGDDAVAVLSVGADGFALVADSATATGVKWTSAVGPAGDPGLSWAIARIFQGA